MHGPYVIFDPIKHRAYRRAAQHGQHGQWVAPLDASHYATKADAARAISGLLMCREEKARLDIRPANQPEYTPAYRPQLNFGGM